MRDGSEFCVSGLTCIIHEQWKVIRLGNLQREEIKLASAVLKPAHKIAPLQTEIELVGAVARRLDEKARRTSDPAFAFPWQTQIVPMIGLHKATVAAATAQRNSSESDV
ncbi:MAG: hypothetical protein OHK0047_20090 [Leptolyngbyaceae cyanobacterium]